MGPLRDFAIPDPRWTLDAADKIEALIALGEAAAAQVGDAVFERFFTPRAAWE